MENKMSWQEFCNEMRQSDYIYSFKYQNTFIQIWAETKGVFKKVKSWYFSTHKHDNKGSDVYSIYKTPQLLLENVCIDGKSLQQIWNDLEID